MTSKQEQFYKQQIADLQVENAALKEQVAELFKVNAELVGKELLGTFTILFCTRIAV